MKVFVSGLVSSLIVCVSPVIAQTVAATPVATLAPSVPTAPVMVPIGTVSNANVLRMGTPVTLKMAEAITTKGKKLEPGYLAHLEVLDPVLVNGVVVIPAGSPAIAEITDVRNKGLWGKSGKINGRMLYVTVGDRKIRLRGVFDDKGVTGTAGVVAAIAFVPVAGFFTTGTSASLPLGAAVKGFVDEDVPLMVAAAPAAAPAPASSAVPAAAVAAAPTK
jgi:hypothetical protein